VTAPRTPAAFIGHGSPMNTLDRNRFTEAWRTFGRSIERPRAVLVISAHWYINATAVTAMGQPRTIHDFYGFPDELFAFDYPAPGLPELAEEVAEVAQPRWVGIDQDSWGLDHGTWSVLAHIFPDADVPVVQLSLDAQQSIEEHADLAARLTPLRDHGVLIIGSGNVVHNLGLISWSDPDGAFDWNARFDEAARAVIEDRPEDVAKLRDHPDYQLAVPTPDHFLPFVHIAGLAAAGGSTVEPLVEGPAFGSLSMASYVLDGPAPAGEGPPDPSAAVPDPSVVPPDQTNI
jgi:4,5-DOPA dioxygenase extradiol